MSTPREKVSTVLVYRGLSFKTSGGMYKTAPGCFVVMSIFLGLSISFDWPKSAILTVPSSVRSMFLSVRSRWMIGFSQLCKKNRPTYDKNQMEKGNR